MFPEAERLRVELDLERSALAASQEAALFFEHILEISPALVAKIRAVKLFMNSVSIFESIHDAVTDFVARCALSPYCAYSRALHVPPMHFLTICDCGRCDCKCLAL